MDFVALAQWSTSARRSCCRKCKFPSAFSGAPAKLPLWPERRSDRQVRQGSEPLRHSTVPLAKNQALCDGYQSVPRLPLERVRSELKRGLFCVPRTLRRGRAPWQSTAPVYLPRTFTQLKIASNTHTQHTHTAPRRERERAVLSLPYSFVFHGEGRHCSPAHSALPGLFDTVPHRTDTPAPRQVLRSVGWTRQ